LHGKDAGHCDGDAQKVKRSDRLAQKGGGDGDAEERVEEVEGCGAGGADRADESEPDQRRGQTGYEIW
jgi:hypothetical protein